MTHDEKWAQIDRLLAAMPSSLADFYAELRREWPALWANVSQVTVPIDAASYCINHLHKVVYAAGLVPTPEELIAYFEAQHRE